VTPTISRTIYRPISRKSPVCGDPPPGGGEGVGGGLGGGVGVGVGVGVGMGVGVGVGGFRAVHLANRDRFAVTGELKL